MPEPVHMVIASGAQKGREISVPPHGARVGRTARNDIVIEDPRLSRHHCRFFFKGEELWVADLGSANGTLINDRPIHEARCQARDRITLGDTVFRVVYDGERAAARIVRPPPPPEPAPPRRRDLPAWIRRGAWLLLTAWFLFLAYALTFPPPTAETPALSAETPARLEQPPPHPAQPMPDAAGETQTTAADSLDLSAAADEGAQLTLLKRDLAAALAREQFTRALGRLGRESAQTWSRPARDELDELRRFIMQLAGMDAAVAAAISGKLGEPVTVYRDGLPMPMLTQAVAGNRVSVVSTDRTTSFALPVSQLPPAERSRWLGEARSPETRAMQFILNLRAGDYAAARSYAPDSGPLAEAFAELLPPAGNRERGGVP